MMFLKKTVRIVIKNQNLAIEAKTGTNLYHALVSENVIPPTLCGGNGQCGKCKVHISQKNMVKPNKKEQLVLARINLEAGYRLACQNIIKGDMVVDTSEITASPMPNDFVIKPTAPKTQEDASSVFENAPAQTETPPDIPVLEEPHPLPAVKTAPKKKVEVPHFTPLDGLLLVQQKKQIRYFLYSAAIDGIAQEGVQEGEGGLVEYLESGMLSDYVHDVLKIKDMDRIIILSDEPAKEGENLFNIASYSTFDIGAMPCELVGTLPEIKDLSLFLRFLSMKGKKRLMIPLDRLDRSCYSDENAVVEIPRPALSPVTNLFDIAPIQSNPIIEINDDLRQITTLKPFNPPDSLPLSILLKVASQMIRKKLADTELRIYPRNRLDPSVPLEYVVKVTQRDNLPAFYLYRDKESSLVITQEMFTKLALARKYIHYAAEYTESNLGSIDAIVFTTAAPIPEFLDHILSLPLVPKQYENSTVYHSGDSAVTAVKLFQEPDIRSYIRKHYGTFSTSG